MSFFTTLWYLFTGPFTGKFMWAFKSEEQIATLKESAESFVICEVKFVPETSKRQARKAIKQLLGRKCQKATDTYLGLRIHDFFTTFPNDSKVIADMLTSSGRNASMIVMMKGTIAATILDHFDNGQLYSGIDNLLISKPMWHPWDVKTVYNEKVSSKYDQYLEVMRGIPDCCPICSSEGWILQSDNTCDDCGNDVSEYINTNLKAIGIETRGKDDIKGKYDDMEKYRIDTGEDLFKGLRAA